ncbi:hydrogenase maturation protease [Archaeoglobus neptunius]|uniref:hydrogenase maturation protease n=1 Tax=Archaeoglobus neptunius TaxID=2798580 RepID=UPI00192703B5|nr:hydrogenase maturation protease [Archaeoglobus neptunius]
MRKILVGIGNPYLGDDAAGIRAAEAAAKLFHIDVAILHTTSLELVDLICEYDRAVIVDSIFGENPGTVHVFGIDDLKARRITGSHSIGLAESLLLGREFTRLPEITIIGIEICSVSNQTGSVRKALDTVLDIIEYELCWR